MALTVELQLMRDHRITIDRLPMTFPERYRWIVSIALAITLLFNALTMTLVPAGLQDDDGGYSAAAYTFWATGKPGVPGYRDVVSLNRDVWAFGRISAAFQGFLMKAGGVSALNAMAPTFIAGVVLLICTGGLATAIYGPDAGRLAMLALAMSGKFFLATHSMRPDVLFAAFLIASIWVIAASSTIKPRPALFAAGLIMGLSTDVHVNGFFLSPVPVVFWIVLSRPSPRAAVGPVCAYGLAMIMGAGLWFLLHYLGDPGLFWRQLPVMGGATHGLRVMALGVPGAIIAEATRYIDWFWNCRGHRHMPEALCVLAGAIWTWRQGSAYPGLRASFVAWCSMFVLSACFLSNPFGWYLIYVWPLFSIWMACTFIAHRQSSWALSLAAILVASHALDLGLWSYKAAHDVPFQAQVQKLRNLIPSESPVLASGVWWFAFWDRDYTDIAYASFRQSEAALDRTAPAFSWETERDRCGWQYVVASNRLLRFLDPGVSDVEAASGPRSDTDDVTEIRRFVHARATTTETLPGIENRAIVFHLQSDP